MLMKEASPAPGESVFVTDYVLNNGMVFSGDTRTPISALVREIFHDAVYAAPFQDTLSPVVLDLGANVGVFAVWASIPPRCGTVYAVEPVPSSFTLLKRNVRRILGPSGAYLLPAAVAKQSGDSVLYLDRSASCDSLIAPPSSDLAARVVGTVIVEALTLPEVYDWFSLASCDVLKLDIEGSECDVLGAVSDDDLRRARRIIVETHDYLVPGSSAFIHGRLKSAGFDIRRGALDELLVAVQS
jgi:FkbM family methyltransferase